MNMISRRYAPLLAALAIALSGAQAFAQMPDIEWARGGHVGEVTAIAVLDERTACSAGLDAVIKLWDLESHRLLRVVPTDGAGIRAMSIAADAPVAATADIDGRIRLYDTRDWSLRRSIPASAASDPLDVALSGDGATVVAGCADGTARLFSTSTGELAGELSGHTERLNDVDITRDGRLVATASDDYSTKIWSVETRAVVRRIQEVQYAATSVAFSPDGARIACIGASQNQSAQNRAVVVFEIDSWNAIARVHSSYNTAVTSIAFSDDGRYIVSTSMDYAVPGSILSASIFVSDLDGSKRTWGLQQELVDRWINVAVISLDARRLVWANPTGAIREVPLASDTSDRIIVEDPAFVSSHLAPVAAFARAGDLILSGDVSGRVFVHDAADGRRVDIVEAHTMGLNAIAVTDDASHFATASVDGSVKIWSIDGFRPERTLYLSAEWEVADVEWLRDGRLIAAIGFGDSIAVLLDSSSSEPVVTYRGNSGPINAIAVSPDERLVASAADDGTLRIWDVATGMLRHVVPAFTEQATALEFTADGATLFAGSAFGQLATIDADAGILSGLTDAHRSTLSAIALTADGRLMVTAGADSTIRVWHVDVEGPRFARSYTYPAAQQSLALDEDKARLFSGSADASVIAWRFSATASAFEEEPIGRLRIAGIRPQPARSATTVRLDVAESAQIEATLLDMFGRTVLSLELDGVGAGERELSLDLSSVPSGMYVLRLATTIGVASSALIVAR